MGRLKLKSSFKSLQEAITGLKPIGPLCIQEAKTHSFREVDLYSSFNYLYYAPSTYSSSSSSSSSVLSKLVLAQPHIEEDFLSSAPTTSTMSSSSLTAEPDEDPSNLPKGPISSTRFFFNPCTTKSIMEEAKAESTDVLKILPFGDPWPETGVAAGVEKVSFREESVALAMASDDPYNDFRASMAEMVEVHQLREWPRLQELLHCYLRLNEEKTHKIIVLAFVDLLMHLVSKDKEGFPASFPTQCQPQRDC